MPSDWGGAGKSGTIQLETRPRDPYSVNVSYRLVDGHLYVNAGDTVTRWAKSIAANPDVRIRMAGALYDLRTERVDSRQEIARFGEAWTSGSMFMRDPTQFDEVWIYRLVPR